MICLWKHLKTDFMHKSALYMVSECAVKTAIQIELYQLPLRLDSTGSSEQTYSSTSMNLEHTYSHFNSQLI